MTNMVAGAVDGVLGSLRGKKVRAGKLKRALMATAAVGGAMLSVQAADAHTDALGFVIVADPDHPGKFITKVYYGSYHPGALPAEGSAKLTIAGVDAGTAPFVLVPGYTNLPKDSRPPELVLGTNFFYANSSGPLSLTSTAGGVRNLQYATFTNLAAGNYSFNYLAGTLSSVWTPYPAISSGTFSITDTGNLGSVGGVTIITIPNIDTALAAYTTAQLVANSVNPVFSGGTLTVSTTQALATNFTIGAAGGTINTAGNTLTLNGTVVDASGASGRLVKAGAGTLILNATSTRTGDTFIQNGTLQLNNLAAAGSCQNYADASLLVAGDRSAQGPSWRVPATPPVRRSVALGKSVDQ